MTLLYIGTSIIILFSCTAKSSLDMINQIFKNSEFVHQLEVNIENDFNRKLKESAYNSKQIVKLKKDNDDTLKNDDKI